MAGTYTNTTTSTYTEARARYVMGKVQDDFTAMENRGILKQTTSENWKEEILWFMAKKALIFFEIQFSIDGQVKCALKYNLQDGNCLSDDESGGTDYWDLPKHTQVSILISWDRNSPFVDEIKEKTKGWGTGQSLPNNNSTEGNIYSKGGLGLTQQKTGW